MSREIANIGIKIIHSRKEYGVGQSHGTSFTHVQLKDTPVVLSG